MSYDVSASVAGNDSDESAELKFALPSGEDLARLERLLARLRVLDPSARIEETRKQDVLCGFVVADAQRLPYVEVDSRAGFISMSLASDPAGLYRTLHAVTEAFDASGYVLFDHQLGAAIQPAASFEAYMQQFSSQWDSQPAFERWLQATGTAPSTQADPISRPKAGSGRSSLVPIIVLLLVVLWGISKLHKAGYF